ncbi:phosphoglycerate dehydrogenase [Garciella nitratireducens]|uniref:phosphoglycerate dehydrogenase n=1 Tax=Garciella nitratireducens TaxID=218205 RepID=UPI000DE829C6|nr:phosphoglycerate dehydrogenase [Garciella nitratireducens]RBP46981.1 D-3-phosphoglycerate dehydrogenase [Garciella nitratireducens]
MKKKILITPRSFGKTNDVPFKILEKHGYEIIRNQTGEKYSEQQLIDIIEEMDGIIVGLDPISRKVLEKAKNLKVVTKYGVGLDNIDLRAAKRLGIQVTFTPGANDESVADFTFSLMLSVSRHIKQLDEIVRNDCWGKIIGTEVYGKTLGIIGTGAIGKDVARRARGFNMEILAYDIYPDENFAKKIGLKYVDKKTLLKNSDFISFHVPLTDEMYHFIDEEELKMMKDSAIIINTSRGGIINEDSLYYALRDKKIAAAALDVFENEPPINSRLLELDNVLLSPHCGASTIDATNRMGLMAVEGLISILEEKEPKYLVKI